ncbi:MAG: hypothetical protein ARM1_0050 [Candidatus Micrarchaeota archaeon]|nr:MAG: hypothetical protein ARM1_0050 [Candidatus Micrarchaeota archaeon]
MSKLYALLHHVAIKLIIILYKTMDLRSYTSCLAQLENNIISLYI